MGDLSTVVDQGNADMAAACPMSELRCDGVCREIMTDGLNCGECGHLCEAGMVCADGVCGLSCSGGTTACDSRCVDTQTDEAHCGGCGALCTAGERCAAGECESLCSDGQTYCDGCVSTATDLMNCGSCGTVCGAREECEAGLCASICSCTAGSTRTCDAGGFSGTQQCNTGCTSWSACEPECNTDADCVGSARCFGHECADRCGTTNNGTVTCDRLCELCGGDLCVGSFAEDDTTPLACGYAPGVTTRHIRCYCAPR